MLVRSHQFLEWIVLKSVVLLFEYGSMLLAPSSGTLDIRWKYGAEETSHIRRQGGRQKRRRESDVWGVPDWAEKNFFRCGASSCVCSDSIRHELQNMIVGWTTARPLALSLEQPWRGLSRVNALSSTLQSYCYGNCIICNIFCTVEICYCPLNIAIQWRINTFLPIPVLLWHSSSWYIFSSGDFNRRKCKQALVDGIGRVAC